MTNRPWTTLEQQHLRQSYGNIPLAEIARQLNRTLDAVSQRSRRIGIAVRRRAEFGPKFKEFLRRKNAQGWSDGDIADAWGASVSAVHRWRRRLQLTNNAYSPRQRKKSRRHAILQCRDAGVKSLSELRSVSISLRAFREGWPAGLRLCELNILNAMDAGPGTRRQLCERMGRKWSRKYGLMDRDNHSILAALRRRGYVRRKMLANREFIYELAIVRQRQNVAA